MPSILLMIIDNQILMILAMERHAAKAVATAAEVTADRSFSGGTEGEKEEDVESDESQGEKRSRVKEGSQSRGSGFDNMLVGATLAKEVDMYKRARTPYSSGFLFSVQPDSKVVKRKESNVKAFGQTRAAILKKMQQTGSKGKGVGTKLNPRAIDMARSGRNKA